MACSGTAVELAFQALASREWLGLAGMKHWFDPIVGLLVRADLVVPGISGEAETSSSEYRIHSVALDPRLVELARADGERGNLAAFGIDGKSTKHEGRGKGVGTLYNQVLVSEDGHPGWHWLSKEASPFSLLGPFADRPACAARRLQPPHFSSALRDALTTIKLSPWYDDFLSYLKVLRPSVTSIESIAVGDRDEPFIFEQQPRVGYPVAYAGDGFYHTLLVASALAKAKGGTAALDEPQIFAHPRMMPTLPRLFHRAVKDGTQVLVATHSLELVAATLDEFGADIGQVVVIGLRLEAGELDPNLITGPEAFRRVLEMKDDLRL
ncbi:MAG: ATP-binding protein [Planctomycetes bacterium]|nr:ATP-binding protein [Planctomycetota bacterium]